MRRGNPTQGKRLAFYDWFGGRDRARTGDPLLAKQVLSQLSYTPTVGAAFILKHLLRFPNPFRRRIYVRCSEFLLEAISPPAVNLSPYLWLLRPTSPSLS